MKIKKKTVKHYYDLMISQKKAYETGPATMSRIDVIWRKSIAPFWKNIEPKQINQELVVGFINWHKKHREGIQLVNVFKYLGNIFNVMVESGAMELSKKPKLELPKTEQLHHSKQKGRYITDEEFKAILNKTDSWFKLFILIAYTAGLRKMEIGKLESERIKKVNDRYIIYLNTDNTKTGLARQVPLSLMLNQYIENHLFCKFQTEDGGKESKFFNQYFFNNGLSYISPQAIDQKWAKAKKNAGIVGKMRFHDLRHTCASNMAKDKISPILATTLLGMSLQMFQKTYLKLSSDDLIEASESAVKRLESK